MPSKRKPKTNIKEILNNPVISDEKTVLPPKQEGFWGWMSYIGWIYLIVSCVHNIVYRYYSFFGLTITDFFRLAITLCFTLIISGVFYKFRHYAPKLFHSLSAALSAMAILVIAEMLEEWYHMILYVFIVLLYLISSHYLFPKKYKNIFPFLFSTCIIFLLLSTAAVLGQVHDRSIGRMAEGLMILFCLPIYPYLFYKKSKDGYRGIWLNFKKDFCGTITYIGWALIIFSTIATCILHYKMPIAQFLGGNFGLPLRWGEFYTLENLLFTKEMVLFCYAISFLLFATILLHSHPPKLAECTLLSGIITISMVIDFPKTFSQDFSIITMLISCIWLLRILLLLKRKIGWKKFLILYGVGLQSLWFSIFKIDLPFIIIVWLYMIFSYLYLFYKKSKEEDKTVWLKVLLLTLLTLLPFFIIKLDIRCGCLGSPVYCGGCDGHIYD